MSPHLSLPRIRPLTLALRLVFALPLVTLPSSAAAEDGITDLGTLGTGSWSQATGASTNGSVVVGTTATSNNSVIRAYRWTGSGMADLGTLGNSYSDANGVSANGSVVVGSSWTTGGYTRAYRWTSGGGMIDLGTLGGSDSSGYGVSADGKVVVGEAYPAGSGWFGHAFRWILGASGGVAGNVQMYDLGTLGGTASMAWGASADGAVVVGHSDINGDQSMHAFRWVLGATGGTGTNDGTGASKSGGAMYDLGTLGGASSYAFDVSADGAVVVGYAKTSSDADHAFRWVLGANGGVTGNPQMYDLGTLGGGASSRALSVSDDGAVVVGKAHVTGTTFRAFRWSQSTGMQTVEDWLRAGGVTVPADMTAYARATNSNGSVVVGQLTNNHAFIARLGAAGSGLVTLDDVQDSLSGTARGGAMTLASTNMLIHGAHGRPLARRVAAGQKTYWLAGDWGADDHGARSGDLGLVEIGFGHHLGWGQINVSLGQTWARQHQVLNGHAETDGTYLLAEALIPVHGNLWASLGGYGHWGEADLTRGYLNAGVQDFSSARPNVDTWGLRARLDWDHAHTVAGVGVTPYVDLSYAKARLDAYTETGGGFPAHFAARSDEATELSVGMNAAKPLANGMTLLGTLEAAHRFEKSGARTVGEVIGLFGFDLAGEPNRRNWLRAGIGLEGRLFDGRASLSLNVTTRGEMPNAWLAANWQKAF